MKADCTKVTGFFGNTEAANDEVIGEGAGRIDPCLAAVVDSYITGAVKCDRESDDAAAVNSGATGLGIGDNQSQGIVVVFNQVQRCSSVEVHDRDTDVVGGALEGSRVIPIGDGESAARGCE